MINQTFMLAKLVCSSIYMLEWGVLIARSIVYFGFSHKVNIFFIHFFCSFLKDTCSIFTVRWYYLLLMSASGADHDGI